MKNLRIIRIALSGIRMLNRYKLRSFFMMLGVVIGITALSVSLTLGKGIEKNIMTSVRKFFKPNNVVITSERIEKEGMREGTDGPNSSLRIPDAEAIAAQIEGVTGFDYLQILPEQDISWSDKHTTATVKGCRPEGEFIWNKPIASGRFFNDAELAGSGRVAVLGPKLAKTLFGEQDPIGQQFRIRDYPFTVIGVASSQGADPHGNDLDEELYIPITTLMRRLANVDYIMAIKFEFPTEEAGIEAAENIRQVLRERHALSADQADDFTLMTPVQVREIIDGFVRVFKVLIPVIAGISLLAGGIIIIVLMNMAVGQRSGEISLRKALGARNEDIGLQFIAETLVVVFVGGLTGLGLGLFLSGLMSSKMGASFYIPPETIIIGLLLSLLTGFVSALLPARKAARMDPVSALK